MVSIELPNSELHIKLEANKDVKIVLELDQALESGSMMTAFLYAVDLFHKEILGGKCQCRLVLDRIPPTITTAEEVFMTD
jgi:hypothetical protein